MPPASLDERILDVQRPSPSPRLLLRAAAATLLLVGAGLATALLAPSGPEYPRLNLKVIIEAGNGETEEALREEIFGPAMPVLTADGGDARGTGR